MESSSAPNQGDADEYGPWFGFWGPMAGLGLLAILGALFGGSAEAPGDETCGVLLSVAAILLAFLRLKARFDAPAASWAGFLLVDDVANLVAAIAVFSVLGLVGLFVAAANEAGSLHAAGVALFVASGLAVFLSLKNVFDRRDAAG